MAGQSLPIAVLVLMAAASLSGTSFLKLSVSTTQTEYLIIGFCLLGLSNAFFLIAPKQSTGMAMALSFGAAAQVICGCLIAAFVFNEQLIAFHALSAAFAVAAMLLALAPGAPG